MTPDIAEQIALNALGFLAASDELLPIFQGASGASLDDMKNRAHDAEFLTSVLEFLMLDDNWVIAFCDANGLEYTTPMIAVQALPGGQKTHWT